MINKEAVDKLLSDPKFIEKMAHKYPEATRVGYLSSRYGTSGNPTDELRKIASYIGAKSYMNRRQRAIINTGLISLSEVTNG
jgi:hypothetical protein